MHGGERIEDPLVVWRPSPVTTAWLQDMVARSVLGSQAELLWRASDGDFPMEDKTEVVVFTSFFERGFGIPTGTFFRGMLHHYGIEVTHFKPNSILTMSFFIHLCEAFIGTVPHFNLWRC